jgi:hypothetical protein
MKKTYLYIALLMGASTLFSSCSDFLDREPITAPNNESFLSGESQVRGYINGLYTALPSLQKFGLVRIGCKGIVFVIFFPRTLIKRYLHGKHHSRLF